jgi:hypothetical protein
MLPLPPYTPTHHSRQPLLPCMCDSAGVAYMTMAMVPMLQQRLCFQRAPAACLACFPVADSRLSHEHAAETLVIHKKQPGLRYAFASSSRD